jgi:aryl-alcohol dehydrogenase-like predicted oxidoreductase
MGAERAARVSEAMCRWQPKAPAFGAARSLAIAPGGPEGADGAFVRAIKEMRDAGKIRHVGLSGVGRDEIERARKIVPIATVQNRYNFSYRKWDAALNYCEKERLGFMPWSPVGGGRSLTDSAVQGVAKEQNVSVYQVAIAWLLHPAHL